MHTIKWKVVLLSVIDRAQEPIIQRTSVRSVLVGRRMEQLPATKALERITTTRRKQRVTSCSNDDDDDTTGRYLVRRFGDECTFVVDNAATLSPTSSSKNFDSNAVGHCDPLTTVNTNLDTFPEIVWCSDDDDDQSFTDDSRRRNSLHQQECKVEETSVVPMIHSSSQVGGRTAAGDLQLQYRKRPHHGKNQQKQQYRLRRQKHGLFTTVPTFSISPQHRSSCQHEKMHRRRHSAIDRKMATLVVDDDDHFLLERCLQSLNTCSATHRSFHSSITSSSSRNSSGSEFDTAFCSNKRSITPPSSSRRQFLSPRSHNARGANTTEPTPSASINTVAAASSPLASPCICIDCLLKRAHANIFI